MYLQRYGEYDEEQLASLKKRNADLVGHTRHYDEIVSHGRNRHCVRGYIADRSFQDALPDSYYQTMNGNAWGLEDLKVVHLALSMSETRTDFPFGAFPPGHHLPKWSAEENPEFEKIIPSSPADAK
jgi:hypothetical protein